jgi:hypothetical protein
LNGVQIRQHEENLGNLSDISMAPV